MREEVGICKLMRFITQGALLDTDIGRLRMLYTAVASSVSRSRHEEVILPIVKRAILHARLTHYISQGSQYFRANLGIGGLVSGYVQEVLGLYVRSYSVFVEVPTGKDRRILQLRDGGLGILDRDGGCWRVARSARRLNPR